MMRKAPERNGTNQFFIIKLVKDGLTFVPRFDKYILPVKSAIVKMPESKPYFLPFSRGRKSFNNLIGIEI